MSVSGISSTSLFSTESAQQIQKEFQQLGQDLQSENLSAAQSDFTTLQSLTPQNNSASTSQSNNPIAQAFNQLAKDLHSGNLSAAQQDYKAIQQNFKNHAPQAQNSGSSPNLNESEITQLLDQLGQALKSDNLSGAQSAFSSLQQQFQELAQNNGSQSSTQSSSSNLSVSV
jgi:outer membrane protein assembly factor BamD (BamD/ComL family)